MRTSERTSDDARSKVDCQMVVIGKWSDERSIVVKDAPLFLPLGTAALHSCARANHGDAFGTAADPTL